MILIKLRTVSDVIEVAYEKPSFVCDEHWFQILDENKAALFCCPREELIWMRRA